MSNAKISFYLKAVPGEFKPVIMKINFGYKEVNPLTGKTKYVPLIYNTKMKLLKKDWNAAENLPKSNAHIGELESLKSKVINTYNHLSNYGEVTPKSLKEELDDILGRKKKAQTVIGLCSYIEQKILTRSDLHPRTIDHYEVLQGKLEKYEQSTGVKLTNESFDRSHYLAFQNRCKNELGKSNSVWGVMKNLKSVLNKMRRDYKGLNVFNPTDELGREEKVQLTSDPKVYFDFDQIKKIIEYQPKNEKYKNVKLILLTLIFTGCRYSDVFKIKPTKEYSDDSISFRYAHFISQKGGGKEIIVPILKPLEDAFKENGNEPARKISSVKFNQYVKELCELMEFDEEIQIAYTSTTGEKKFESKKLFKFVSSHIGRRSFITNLINAVPITILSKITGHSFSDKSVIFKYNKISILQNAVLFAKELKRLCADDMRKEEFPIQLI